MKKTDTLIKKTVYALIFIVGFLLVWWLVALSVNDEYIVPNIGTVLQDAFKIFYVEQFYSAYFSTLLCAVIGFACSFVVGFSLALLAVKSVVVKNLCSPLVSLVRLVPTMAIASLVWLILLLCHVFFRISQGR